MVRARPLLSDGAIWESSIRPRRSSSLRDRTSFKLCRRTTTSTQWDRACSRPSNVTAPACRWRAQRQQQVLALRSQQWHFDQIKHTVLQLNAIESPYYYLRPIVSTVSDRQENLEWTCLMTIRNTYTHHRRQASVAGH